MVIINRYYCNFCRRYHYRGKIYQKHLNYQEKKKKKTKANFNLKNKKIPTNKFIQFKKNELRPIAKRQINRLFRKMYLTKKFNLYTREINKIIIYEQKLRCNNCG